MATKTLSKLRKAEIKASALESLKAYDIKLNEIIWTDTNYVGNVGTAYVRAWLIRDGQPVPLTWLIGNATAQTLKDRDGRWVIHTGGYGYSRGQHVIDALSWALFGQGGQLKDREI
jgi:hypothetical protein